jgi:lipopolysaccharide biosynthesis protein
MKRLGILAHYDPEGEVKRYVLHHLHALREVCDPVWFVSSAHLSPTELEKTRHTCAKAWTRENVGFDFGMWKEAIGRTDPSSWDEVVLTNSSVYGPLWPLSRAFEKMREEPADVWGMTDNVEEGWHLQSYFLAVRSRLLHSPAFLEFWRTFEPLENKRALIDAYEVGFSRFVLAAGFRARSFAPYALLPERSLVRRLRSPHWKNPTILQPLELLERRMPYVKVALFRDNPAKVPLRKVRAVMERAGYDLTLVE